MSLNLEVKGMVLSELYKELERKNGILISYQQEQRQHMMIVN